MLPPILAPGRSPPSPRKFWLCHHPCRSRSASMPIRRAPRRRSPLSRRARDEPAALSDSTRSAPLPPGPHHWRAKNPPPPPPPLFFFFFFFYALFLGSAGRGAALSQEGRAVVPRGLSRGAKALWNAGRHRGSPAALTGGDLMVRLMRGSNHLWSVHSWGAAIDLDPQHNPFPAKWRPGFLPKEAAACFEKQGLVWRGANGECRLHAHRGR